MIPYFLLLLIPSIFALSATRRLAIGAWYITFFIYVVFVGLRFDVGPDWEQYGRIHHGLSYASFWDLATQVEPLSHLLFWISENGGFEIYLSNLVAAIIMMIGVFSFARRTANPWLALVAATPYFIIVIGMSGIRQAMAAGIILFLFSRWEHYSFIRRGIYILAAALFHTSALVNNIFLIIKLDIAPRYKILLGLAILTLTLFLSFELPAYADNVVKYQERYLVGATTNRSYGSLFHIAMIAVPALLSFIYKKRIIHNTHNQSLLKFGLYAAVAVFIINFFSSTAASRLTVYMYFLPMMVYPALVTNIAQQSRMGSVMLVIIYHLMILAAWFVLGNVSFSYVPYQNILLHGF
jgi:hypothetical protein